MCSSTAGGRWLSVFSFVLGCVAVLAVLLLPALEGDDEGEDDGIVGEPEPEREEIPVKASENRELNVLDAGEAGALGMSKPSRSSLFASASRLIVDGLLLGRSASDDGKKLRNRCSACQREAFLNSTQTSILPGRQSAGSRRSR